MKKIKLLILIFVAALTLKAKEEESKFENAVNRATVVADAINKKASNPEIIAKIINDLVNNEDKKKLKEHFEKIKFLKFPKITTFLNQVRIESEDRSQVLFSLEVDQNSNNLLIVNGVLKIKFDPNNLWKSLIKDDVKFSKLNLILSKAFAGDSSEVISTVLLTTSAGASAKFKLPKEEYFIKEKKISFLFFHESFAVQGAQCNGDNRAKSIMPEYNLKIYEEESLIKAIFGKDEESFTIKFSGDDQALALNKECFEEMYIRNLIEQWKYSYYGDSPSPFKDTLIKSNPKSSPKSLQAWKPKEICSDIKNIDLQIQKCTKLQCVKSTTGELFDKMLNSDDEFKAIQSNIAELEKKKTMVVKKLSEMKSSDSDSGKEASKTATNKEKIRQITSEIETQQNKAKEKFNKVSQAFVTELINISAIGKCCANRDCRGELYKKTKINLDPKAESVQSK